jgi:hypothetical protein
MSAQQLTGRAIQQGLGSGLGQGLGKMMNLGIGTEIIYSFVIIVCSLMIYFATKELYSLTKHKGIKYFRLSFLFFALAYFFRSFIKIILFYFNKQEIRTILPIFGNITLLFFIYFSIMAIFFLVYSVLYKRYKQNPIIYLMHIVAVIISLIMTLSGFPLSRFLLLNLLLFIFIAYAVYTAYHQSKNKKHVNLYIIYLLLSIFWIFNILDILIPNFLQTFQLIIYLISSGIFLTILYKVLRKTN